MPGALMVPGYKDGAPLLIREFRARRKPPGYWQGSLQLDLPKEADQLKDWLDDQYHSGRGVPLSTINWGKGKYERVRLQFDIDAGFTFEGATRQAD